MTDSKLNAYMLTTAQELALSHFEEGAWRGVFPDVNPRTASALRNLGLLEYELGQGRKLYRLSARGREMLMLLQLRDA